MFHEAEEERARNRVGAGVKRYLREPMQAVAHEVGKRVPFVGNVAGEVQGTAEAGNGAAAPPPAEDGLRRRKNGVKVATGGTDDVDPALRDFDPEKYQRYKKKLKVALMEYYKELEILKNFRVGCVGRIRFALADPTRQILNLTGFKKALKKFEKTARVGCPAFAISLAHARHSDPLYRSLYGRKSQQAKLCRPSSRGRVAQGNGGRIYCSFR